MKKKNIIKIVISTVLSVILLIGVTYAAWNFLTEKTNIVMTIGGDQISFDAGTNITVDNMLPVYSMEEGITKDITVYKQEGDYTAGIDLYLNLKSWPTEMSSASFRWAVYKNGEYLSSGDFSGKKQGNNIKLTSYTQKINLEEKKDTYKLYLWIDAYQESNINMMKQSFTVNLYGQVSFYNNDDPTVNEVEPNAPDLPEGMIPIKYSYALDEWVKADVLNTNNDWYDYYNKMWANAVMVESDKREEYMNATVGTTVSNDDILAYYVWIPRYKYVLFNVNFESVPEREIQIEFQKETDEIFNGTENGEYLTHPAFWWDNNSNGQRETGEELAGIWFGKFRISGILSSPKMKPNLNSSFQTTVYDLFNMARKFQGTEYLTSAGVTTIDAHMTKNMEWGAVAYLSHSKYGTVNGIKSTNVITGRNGNYTYNDFIVVDGDISINKNVGTGVLGSTTGNVYGIYDVSNLNFYEYVMGVMKGTNDEILYSSSGFKASNMPETKYYDLYNYNETSTICTEGKLGDATCETNGWYNSANNFLSKISNGYASWFSRHKPNGGSAYVLNFSGEKGNNRSHNNAVMNISTRSVIVIP